MFYASLETRVVSLNANANRLIILLQFIRLCYLEHYSPVCVYRAWGLPQNTHNVVLS